MKTFVVLTALVAVVAGQFNGRRNGGTSPVYGPPQKDFEEEKPQQTPGLIDDYMPQTFRHVYVHAAEDEAPEEQARTIRIPGGDKHVNIIFVKTPSQSSQSQTEVILPEQDEQKNFVYVLLKKNEAENNIKIRRPQAKQPTKPEVYFIKYKDQEQEQGSSNGGYSQGPSSSPPQQQHSGSHTESHSNGGYTQRRPQQPSHHESRAPPTTFDFDGPSAPAPSVRPSHSEFADAGRYTPAVAPGQIRGPSDVPSSGYGVPL